jgi:hypothetical protein
VTPPPRPLQDGDKAGGGSTWEQILKAQDFKRRSFSDIDRDRDGFVDAKVRGTGAQVACVGSVVGDPVGWVVGDPVGWVGQLMQGCGMKGLRCAGWLCGCEVEGMHRTRGADQ